MGTRRRAADVAPEGQECDWGAKKRLFQHEQNVQCSSGFRQSTLLIAFTGD